MSAVSFDSARGRLVLFGGSDGTLLGDTWEWDGALWLRLSPTAFPAVRYGAAMAFDRARNRSFLFGGNSNIGQWYGDTWQWDGTNWSQLQIPGPPDGYHHAMVYDTARQRCVLFGGHTNAGMRTDTWEFDGTTWRRIPTAHVPSPRIGIALAFDSIRNRVVLFGGLDQTGFLADTWEYDGVDWTQRTGLPAPSARYNAAMCFDEPRGVCVLFGGWGNAGVTDDAWEFDGTSWAQRTTTIRPAQRSEHMLAFDTVNARVLLFGGRDAGNTYQSDTWLYAAKRPASVTSYAPGCAGSSGTTNLTAVPGGLPWLGGRLELQLAGIPGGNAAVLQYGVSRTRWGSTLLPFDLGGIGMPGCRLATSIDAAVVLGGSATSRRFALNVPTSPALLGGTILAQGFVVDPPANGFGAVLSNAVEARFGTR